MIVRLLTELHLEFLSFKGGCTGSSESTHVKIPHCWKPHVMAHILMFMLQDHMWQHKQEERELKRTEGDIIKNQRSVRQTLRDFENGIKF